MLTKGPLAIPSADYAEPKEPGHVSLREHVRKREEEKAEKKRLAALERKQKEEQEYKELRKIMGSFKARSMPNFNKKPFAPILKKDKKPV